MWIPGGVYRRLLGRIRGRVAVIVREEVPQMGLFGVEIQLKVDNGWVVDGGARMIVVEHWEIIKWTRRGKPGPHMIAWFFHRGWRRGAEVWIVKDRTRRRR